MTCMLTVLQGYTSFLAGSPLLPRCLIISVVLSSGTLTPSGWLVTVHRQMGLAQTRSPDQEELLLGESQEMIISFLFNHLLCLLFLFFPLFPLFAQFNIASKMQHSVRLGGGGLSGFFLVCFFFCLCLSHFFAEVDIWPCCVQSLKLHLIIKTLLFVLILSRYWQIGIFPLVARQAVFQVEFLSVLFVHFT